MADKSDSGEADGDADQKLKHSVTARPDKHATDNKLHDNQSRSNEAGQGAVSKRPPMARRPGALNRSTSHRPVTSTSGQATSAQRQFKKCMSATFEIDGHHYTIGR